MERKNYMVRNQNELINNNDYLLCEGDNQNVINLLSNQGYKFQLVYLDPPYNTGRLRGVRKSFIDNNNNSWSENILEVSSLCHNVLSATGFLAVSINQMELFNLKNILDKVFTSNCFIGLFPVKVRHKKRQLMINATFHDLFEYLLIYRKQKSTRFYTTRKPPRKDKFIYKIKILDDPDQVTIINGKKIEIYGPNKYEIIKSNYTKETLRRYVIAGKIATANWSGEWYENYLRQLGENLLIKVWGLEKEGLGYRWFQTGNKKRKSGVYFQSQLTAGRLVLPSNGLDFTEVVPTIYKEGGPNCDFQDSKKPEELLRFLMQICTKPEDIVLDPFAGSGTTLAVAVKMQRSAVLIENNSNTIEIIKRRINNLHSGLDLDGKKYKFDVKYENYN